MATSALPNIKVSFTTPGTKQIIHKVTANGLTTEKVVEVEVKPEEGITTPNEAFGYAALTDGGGTYAVTGGGAGTIQSVTNLLDLRARMKTPNTTTIVAASITNTNTAIATDTTPGAFFQSDQSNITVVGAPGVTLSGFGFGWINNTEQSNIILRNLKFRNMVNVAGGRDYITFKGSSSVPLQAPRNIWADHCDFGGGQNGLDACIDLTDDTRYWTISNCILSDESVCSMVGGLGTFAYNWFRDNLERQPKAVKKFLNGSQSHIHIFNNLYERTSAGDTRWAQYLPFKGYGIGYADGMHVLAEGNIFLNFQGWPFSNMDSGIGAGYGRILARNNKMINSPSTTDRNAGQPASTIEAPYSTASILKSVMSDADSKLMIDYIRNNAGNTLTLAQMGY